MAQSVDHTLPEHAGRSSHGERKRTLARGLALILAVGHQRRLVGGGAEGTPEAVRVMAPAFAWLGNVAVLGVPNPILLMVVLFVAAHLMMTWTMFGRYVYAVGGNPEAVRLSGVPVTAVLLAVYCLCGALAGLAGIVDASRFEGGRPNAGELYELQVIAAVVVGGASLAGGRGRVSGTLIGAMIIAVIQNGLNIAGVASYVQKVVFGALILAAVLLDRLQPRLGRVRRRRCLTSVHASASPSLGTCASYNSLQNVRLAEDGGSCRRWTMESTRRPGRRRSSSSPTETSILGTSSI